MKIFNLSILLSSFFSILFQLLCYKELSGKSIKLNLIKVIHIIFIFWLIIINNFYNIEVLTAPVALLLVVFANLIVFRDNFFITLNTTVISYLLVVAVEILLSIFIILIGIFDMNSFMKYSYLTLLFTFITTYFSYLMCKYIKIFRIISKKINNSINNNSYKVFMIVLFAIMLLVIDFKYVGTFSPGTYIINVCLLISMFILFIAYLYGVITIDKELHKIDVLLDDISKYENIIDKNRVNSHELLNNLILLKSIKNKNTVKFNKLLDDMILSYDSSNTFIKNISLLPKGIKGIVYFKLDKAINPDINIVVNISKRISSILDDISHNDYIVVCRIIPILIDNAIESAKMSEGKNLLFDVYRLNDDIVISIENSCSGNIDINKIRNKYFSTKGVNRGLGLYIINNLLSKSKKIIFEQSCENDYFISKIIIKK